MAILAAAGACLAQTDVDPDVLRLARIKLKMADNLTRLPNYTCTETIERSARRAGSRRFELLDTLRLEVALVEGKELFAWPGAGRFEDREVREFVAGGAIGNGNFGLHARAVFMGQAPVFRFAGFETRDGRKLARYDFTVAQPLSGFQVRVGDEKAIVGYRGTVWADEQTHEAVRLEVHAEEIPPQLALQAVSDTIDYSKIRIGESYFLLPAEGEMVMIDIRGNENRNRIHFSGCRQYAGQSVISFAEPPPAPPPAPKPPPLIELPAGLSLTVQLNSEIDSRRAAVGDPVTALLERDARWKGRLLARKGARVAGRLVQLERRWTRSSRGQQGYFLVGIEFDKLESDLGRAEFRAQLEDVGPVFAPGISVDSSRPLIVGRSSNPAGSGITPRPGTGLFLVRGDSVRLAQGLRMTWTVVEMTQR